MTYILLFAALLPLAAQDQSMVRVVTSAPSGSCTTTNQVRVLASTGAVYQCDGTWTLRSTGGASAISALTDLKITGAPGTVLTFAGGKAACGTTIYTLASVTMTISAGSATSEFGFDCRNAAALVLARGANTITGVSGYNSVADTNLDAYPGIVRLASITAASNAWVAVTDFRSVAPGNGGVVGGSLVNIDRDSNGVPRVNLDAAVITKGTVQQLGFKLWGTGTAFLLQDADDEASVWNNQLGGSITIISVTCESDTGTPTIQLQRDDGSPTNMLSSSLTCATTPATTSTFVSGENVIAAGNRVDQLTVSAGGAAHWVAMTIAYTRQ